MLHSNCDWPLTVVSGKLEFLMVLFFSCLSLFFSFFFHNQLRLVPFFFSFFFFFQFRLPLILFLIEFSVTSRVSNSATPTLHLNKPRHTCLRHTCLEPISLPIPSSSANPPSDKSPIHQLLHESREFKSMGSAFWALWLSFTSQSPPQSHLDI